MGHRRLISLLSSFHKSIELVLFSHGFVTGQERFGHMASIYYKGMGSEIC